MPNEGLLATWKNYQAAWAAISAAERQQLLASSVAEDCVYTDPAVECHGQQELIAYLEQFQQRQPGAWFVNNTFLDHHGQALATWTRFDAQGQATSTGMSYAHFGEDGRLTHMSGFPSPAPATESPKG